VDNQLTHEDMTNAQQLIDGLFARMDQVFLQAKGRYPLYFDGPEIERGIWSKGGSWVGGYWVGLWWLRAKYFDCLDDQQRARAIGVGLRGKLEEDSLNRSMIFWYGAGLSSLWFEDKDTQLLLETAAEKLVADKPNASSFFPIGTAMGGGVSGSHSVTVDTLSSLVQLLRQTGHCELAQQHLNVMIKHCVTTNGIYPALKVIDGHIQGEGVAGDWSRGQAWFMLGLAQAARYWPELYRESAQEIAEYWLVSRGPSIPLNRLSEPMGLKDPSAALIASLAMFNLAGIGSNEEREVWRERASQLLKNLLASPYIEIAPSTARFSGCCYRLIAGPEALVESPWGTFLLIQALCLLTERLSIDEC
jgi:unsaturated chondroitin disaccharide hydrolase